MGIEIPEELGGGGASFFHSVLAVEALSRVDPVGRRAGRRPEHAGHQRAAALGHATTLQAALPAEARRGHRRRLRAVGGRLRQRRVRAGDARDVERGDDWSLTGRKLWITNAHEAGLFIVFANVNPDAGYRGITAFLVERGTAGFTVGKKEDKLGIRASSTCELLFDDCRVPARERARRGRQGLQGRDRDAERRPHRHRRADDRPRAGRARPHDRATPRSASSSARRSPSSRPCSIRSRARRPSSKPRGCSSTTRRGCATPASRSSPRRRCASCSRRRSPSASRRSRSTCSAATAS